MGQEDRHLLLIDEDDGFATRLEGELADEAPLFSLRRARDLETALKMTADAACEAVLLSLSAKRSDPLDTLDALLENGRDLPVIVLAESGADPRLKRALEAGARGYLIRDGALAGLLLQVLGRAAADCEVRRDLRELDWYVRVLFEIAGDAIILADPETGTISEVNRRAVEFYGYSREEFLALKLNDLIFKGSGAELPIGLPQELQGRRTMKVREQHVGKTGRLCYVEVESSTVELHGRAGVLMVVHDLTDLKRQEDEIRFLQQFNSYILDSLPFCITIKTDNHIVTYQNKNSQEIFGPLVGRTIEEAVSEDRSFLPFRILDHLLDGETRHETCEVEWNERRLAGIVFKIKDIRTDLDLVVELLQDVTEQHRIQQDLVSVQRMEAVGNLAGGIAHDFNNLLTGIMGYANLIQALQPEDDNLVQYTQVIEETCQRAADLTRQLLQFARRKADVKELFDVNTIARYAAKLLRHSVKKEVQLVQNLSRDMMIVEGDPAQVQQVLLNLGTEVGQSMSGGKLIFSSHLMTVEAESDTRRLRIKPGDYAAVVIRDTGRAASDGRLAALLDPSASKESETREPVGLGMSVVSTILQSHGGHLRVESNDDGGADVTVLLPLASETVDEMPGEPEEPFRGEETILVIEDEEVIRELMETGLPRYGYRVYAASGGKDGLDLFYALKAEIDLVLLNPRLPDIDGAEVFRTIREMDPRARIILFTGAKGDRQIKALLAEGAVTAISKPVSLKRLSRVLREVLDGGNDGGAG